MKKLLSALMLGMLTLTLSVDVGARPPEPTTITRTAKGYFAFVWELKRVDWFSDTLPRGYYELAVYPESPNLNQSKTYNNGAITAHWENISKWNDTKKPYMYAFVSGSPGSEVFIGSAHFDVTIGPSSGDVMSVSWSVRGPVTDVDGLFPIINNRISASNVYGPNQPGGITGIPGSGTGYVNGTAFYSPGGTELEDGKWVSLPRKIAISKTTGLTESSLKFTVTNTFPAPNTY